jgi:hypothetical protein
MTHPLFLSCTSLGAFETGSSQKGTIKREYVQGPMSVDAHTQRHLAALEIKK